MRLGLMRTLGFRLSSGARIFFGKSADRKKPRAAQPNHASNIAITNYEHAWLETRPLVSAIEGGGAMANERFQILDGWRGVCAVLVALVHLNAYGHFYEVPFIENAWLFVDFFFVLSGFIISHAYMARLEGWPGVRNFIIRRFGRLWPLHATILTVWVGLEVARPILLGLEGFPVDHTAFAVEKYSLASVFTNILMIHSLDIHDTLTWNFPSWSISTEFYTYLVFAALFTLTKKSFFQLSSSLVIAVAGGAIVLFFSKKGWAMDTTYDYGFFRCLYGFFIGHLTYRVWKSGAVREFCEGQWPLEFMAVALVAVFVSLAGHSLWSLAAPLIFALVVLVFAHESGSVSRLMSVRPVALLGAWSYSIYMVHALVLEIIDRGFGLVERITGTPIEMQITTRFEPEPVDVILLGNRWNMDGLAIVYLALVIVVAAITYTLIEQPGRRFFNSFASARRKTADSSDTFAPVTGAYLVDRPQGNVGV